MNLSIRLARLYREIHVRECFSCCAQRPTLDSSLRHRRVSVKAKKKKKIAFPPRRTFHQFSSGIGGRSTDNIGAGGGWASLILHNPPGVHYRERPRNSGAARTPLCGDTAHSNADLAYY